jgi:DNA polymerase-3 subunit gamma/tau
MSRALYRKYRPTSFEEAVGQEHITKTLQRALKSGKISHAYLFTGPRGVGKTSVARILAHEVNGLAYNEGTTHLDIIEIDAASNRRIDEIRELRDKVHITPTSAKYKVYIIDEVHMLTREAFNALLKTLEEPPAHCIFILATTEVHKLPETIVSRTQRFAFKSVENKSAAIHLASIAKKEKIDITVGALELLAEHGKGSFRDSISLLDQLSAQKGKITEDVVRDLVGLPAEPAINNLLYSIENGYVNDVVQNLEVLFNQGVNAAAIAKELSKKLRNELVQGKSQTWIPGLLRQLLDVPASHSPFESLEIALLEVATNNSSKSASFSTEQNMSAAVARPEKKAATLEPKKVITKSQKVDHATQSIVNIPQDEFKIDFWPQIVEQVKKQDAALYTALRLAKPEFADGTLALYFQFPLHQKKVDQSRQKNMIGQIIEDLCGRKITIECEVDKDKFGNQAPQNIPVIKSAEKKEAADPLKTISNIFGKPEVIES